MRWNGLKQIYWLGLMTSLGALTACATTPPPPERQPISATELAMGEWEASPPLINGIPQETIAELPTTTQFVPPKEVNRQGEAIRLQTLSRHTPTDFRLAPNDPVELNFEQGELRQVIEIISESLGLAVVIDPTIGDKVTIRTPANKPLKKRDLWPLLQLLLSDAGVTIEKKGNVFYFKKEGQIVPGSIGTQSRLLTDSDAPEVVQITPLRFISAADAKNLLAPVIQPRGRVIDFPNNLNVVGIVTAPQRLERVNKLLELVDADPFLHRGMRLFRLLNSPAAEVQAELDRVLKAIIGENMPYQVVPLERLNALLVVAPPGAGFKDVELWVDVLDERNEGGTEQIFIYKVRNLEAKELASTLSEVFKEEDDEEEDELRRRREQQEQQDRQQDNQQSPPQLPLNMADNQSPDPQTPTTPASATAVSAELKVRIVADESTNSLIVRSTPRDYKQLLQTIRELDAVPKEVMVNAVIAEVQLNKSNRYGIDWQAILENNYGSVRSNLSNTNTTSSDDDDNSDANADLFGLVINYFSGSLTAVLNLVASEGDISVLSRPSILVRNNEEASINVGESEPVITRINTSSLNNQQLSNDVQYRDTGITLKVTPRINDDGIINLQIEQDISQLGEPRTEQQLQSFSQRKVSTVVVVRDGSAIVIGGLIQTRSTTSNQRIPGFSRIPVMGKALFSSNSDELDRTELVLLLMPKIVDPTLDTRPLVRDFRRRMQATSQLLNTSDFILGDLLGTDPSLLPSVPAFSELPLTPAEERIEELDEQVEELVEDTEMLKEG